MEKLLQDHAEKKAQLKETERKAALKKKKQGKNKKPKIMKKLFE